MSKDTNDILKWIRLVEESEEKEEEQEEFEDDEDDEDEKKPSKKLSKEDVLAWFRENPNPDDDDVHDWAEEMGYEADDLEEIIYKLVTEYAKKRDEE